MSESPRQSKETRHVCATLVPQTPSQVLLADGTGTVPAPGGRSSRSSGCSSSWRSSSPPSSRSVAAATRIAGARAGEAKLAERFAAGEITEQEYRERPRRAQGDASTASAQPGVAQTVVEVRGLTKRYGPAAPPSTASTCRCGAARSTASSVPTAPARRRRCGCCSAWSRPAPARCRCSGRPPGDPAALARVGSLVEAPAFYPYLSGRDNLRVVARYAGVPASRIDDALRTGRPRRPGRRQVRDVLARHEAAARCRRGAAQGPGAGRSSTSRPTGWTRPACATCAGCVRALGADGRTVLLSSHLLGEVQQICDRVGVIDRGRMVAESTVEELRGGTELIVAATPSDVARTELEAMREVESVRIVRGRAAGARRRPPHRADQPDAGRRRRRGHRAAARRAPARRRVPRHDRPRHRAPRVAARRSTMCDVVRAELFKLRKRPGRLGAARRRRRPQPGLRLSRPLPVLPVRRRRRASPANVPPPAGAGQHAARPARHQHHRRLPRCSPARWRWCSAR